MHNIAAAVLLLVFVPLVAMPVTSEPATAIGCITVTSPRGWEQGHGQQGLVTFKSPDAHDVGFGTLRDVFTVRQVPNPGLTLAQYKQEMAEIFSQETSEIDATVNQATGSHAKGVGIAGRGAAQFTDITIDGIPAFDVRVNTRLTAAGNIVPIAGHSVVLLGKGSFYVLSAPVERDRLPNLAEKADSFLRSVRAGLCR